MHALRSLLRRRWRNQMEQRHAFQVGPVSRLKGNKSAYYTTNNNCSKDQFLPIILVHAVGLWSAIGMMLFVCLWRCVLWPNCRPTSYANSVPLSDRDLVNSNCHPRITILQFLTPTPTLSPQTTHLLNDRPWCYLANKLKTYLAVCYLFTFLNFRSFLRIFVTLLSAACTCSFADAFCHSVK